MNAWMNPLDKLRIVDAVKNRQKQVTLVSGLKLNLDYKLGAARAAVYVTCANGALAPRGFLSIKQMEDDVGAFFDA